MIVQSVSSQGAQVAPNDDEKWSRWVWVDSIVNALKWIRNDANASGSAQLTTGIIVHEDECTDLLARIDAAARQAVRRAHSGRAS